MSKDEDKPIDLKKLYEDMDESSMDRLADFTGSAAPVKPDDKTDTDDATD